MSAAPAPLPAVDEYDDYEDEKQPQKHSGAKPIVANTPDAAAKIEFACSPGVVADMHVDPELAPKKGGRPRKTVPKQKKEKEKLVEKKAEMVKAEVAKDQKVELDDPPVVLSTRSCAQPSVASCAGVPCAVAVDEDEDEDEKEFTEKEVIQVLLLGAVSGLALGWLAHKWLVPAAAAASKK